MKAPSWALITIVVSQFFCTSLWFASNAVMGDLVTFFRLSTSALSHLTSFVQFGFIVGTLLFALFTIADRFSPSSVFFGSAIIGATFNLCMIFHWNSWASLLVFRFLTGFFLAGIYPVGMKIAADYFAKGLGKSLSFLVGALVLGTAFPHWLKSATSGLVWQYVVITTSGLAVLGGSLILFFVPDGPFRKSSQKVDLSAFLKVFQNQNFRSAAFGYFGHMWELYAFWTFVPVMLTTYVQLYQHQDWNVSLLCFLVISVGSLSCFIGGYLSEIYGVKRLAFAALLLSTTCCLLSPLLLIVQSESIFIGFLFIWGMAVIADSPLFSTLVAQNASVQFKGTALTIVNCIGFSITIISIQLLNVMQMIIPTNYSYLLLAVGPIAGLIVLGRK